MKTGLILLADGFEESEAVTTHDILSRTHELAVVYVSTSSSLEVVSSMGTIVKAAISLENIDLDRYEFMILPGGKLGVENLKANPLTIEAIRKFHETEKPIFAICAAPSILGELGYLDGKRYTSFPGFQRGKGKYIEAGSVIDGDLVTGHAMAYSLEFAENVVRVLLGEGAVQRLYHGTRGADVPI